ncbi:hypothetical protein ColKHC_10252 [Colletotrichum higginsianum]|nr:hypothetical protein ColKHC_10252 [Colletotrichum higginsianum]
MTTPPPKTSQPACLISIPLDIPKLAESPTVNVDGGILAVVAAPDDDVPAVLVESLPADGLAVTLFRVQLVQALVQHALGAVGDVGEGFQLLGALGLCYVVDAHVHRRSVPLAEVVAQSGLLVGEDGAPLDGGRRDLAEVVVNVKGGAQAAHLRGDLLDGAAERERLAAAVGGRHHPARDEDAVALDRGAGARAVLNKGPGLDVFTPC